MHIVIPDDYPPTYASLEQVDLHVCGEQAIGGIETGRAGADHGDAQRPDAHAVREFKPLTQRGRLG